MEAARDRTKSTITVESFLAQSLKTSSDQLIEAFKKLPEHERKSRFLEYTVNYPLTVSLEGGEIPRAVDAIAQALGYSSPTSLLNENSHPFAFPYVDDKEKLDSIEEHYGMKTAAQLFFGIGYKQHTFVLSDPQNRYAAVLAVEYNHFPLGERKTVVLVEDGSDELMRVLVPDTGINPVSAETYLKVAAMEKELPIAFVNVKSLNPEDFVTEAKECGVSSILVSPNIKDKATLVALMGQHAINITWIEDHLGRFSFERWEHVVSFRAFTIEEQQGFFSAHGDFAGIKGPFIGGDGKRNPFMILNRAGRSLGLMYPNDMEKYNDFTITGRLRQRLSTVFR